MTPTRYAFIKASWHSDIVDQALVGFEKEVGADSVDVFDVDRARRIDARSDGRLGPDSFGHPHAA